MGDRVAKWSSGSHYGPVLSQTDLYLLQTELEVNPILAGKHANFHLLFNLLTGHSGGFNQDARDRDLQFTQKAEPATLPRVAQLIIITPHSPWCTIVKNEKGVTNEDVINALWKDYDEMVTEAEFASIPPRVQEHIKRTAAHNMQARAMGTQWQFYSPSVPPNQYKRIDWVRERIYFDSMEKNDAYALSRLGFKAPNIFKMELSA